MSQAAPEGSNSAQLKQDIDAGRTGDKTQGLDPAAAPLGTDDEAAGRPASPQTIERMRRLETGRASVHRGAANAGDPSRAPAAGPSGGLRTNQVLWVFLLGLVGVLVFGAGLTLSLG